MKLVSVSLKAIHVVHLVKLVIKTHDWSSRVSPRVQDLMGIGMQRQIDIKLFFVSSNKIVQGSCFRLRKWRRSSVGVTARQSGCTQVSCLVGGQPVVSPVAIGIDSIANKRHRCTCLPPVSVACLCVLEAIRVCHRQEVPVDVQGEVLNFGICRTQKLVDEISCSSSGNPFASVNVGFNEKCSISLKSTISQTNDKRR